ncbi:MAG: hypothetical protein AB7P76_05870 [Candidatus Melainabacteria bacterium]
MTDTDDLVGALNAIQAELKTLNATLSTLAAGQKALAPAQLAYPGRPLPSVDDQPAPRQSAGRYGAGSGRSGGGYGGGQGRPGTGSRYGAGKPRPPRDGEQAETRDTATFGAERVRKKPVGRGGKGKPGGKPGSKTGGKGGAKKGGGYPKKAR